MAFKRFGPLKTSLYGAAYFRFPNLVKALGIVKEACALANMELGQLDPKNRQRHRCCFREKLKMDF